MHGYVIKNERLCCLSDLPEPGEPNSGEVLIKVKSVSLNYRDLMVSQGRYGNPFKGSFVAGSDMAGEVVKIGKCVSGIQPGQRVINTPFRNWPGGKLRYDHMKSLVGGGGMDGVFCEYILYPAEALVPMPSHFSYDDGATLPVAGLTAWAAVVSHGKITAGNWVLIHGTGGVSVYAAQIAKMMGAKILLTTSSKKKGCFMKETFGVKEVFDYRDDNWPEQVRLFTHGSGVDLIVDVAGGQTFAKSLKACALHARISLVGVLDGFKTILNPFDIIGRQIEIRGIYTSSTEDLRSLVKAYEASMLKPLIDCVFGFDEIPEAYRYLESQKHIGKIVCRML